MAEIGSSIPLDRSTQELRMNTPLLLIAWRRPHTLRQVIDAIRPVAPTRLYVACDGPNPVRPGEVEKVSATRAVIENEIDWPCQIERLYSDTNRGCRQGVSRAISWFFEQVEEGIILEDDCVPHPDFFPYCTELLERYRHDTRVWCVSGNNFQKGHWRGDGSYYFSRYNHCWGWATWRRCWVHYDADLRQWPALKASGLLGSIFENPREARYWARIWDRLLREGKPDSWAYRWTFTCFANGGLTALPNLNLVKNVGFGEDACHTISEDSTGSPLSRRAEHPSGLLPLQHPKFTVRNLVADAHTYHHHFARPFRSRVARRLKLLKIPRWP
ncbi:glycosyltransferase family A protein [Cyanobium sp. CH-040]|uniref:glycosyltransferase family A protein n=1 Tax=Cyanobium sp. CH-040 TaxID=2823708 RepID=UPI0020CBA2ED|nr:glycosyltransferase family A protein [Cyanobium sp. CH-040]MCP9927193.1 glycosyltransferase family 2 protein [Cyanobium sp. CH-040]